MSNYGKCKAINHDYTGKLNADGYCEMCESLMAYDGDRQVNTKPFPGNLDIPGQTLGRMNDVPKYNDAKDEQQEQVQTCVECELQGVFVELFCPANGNPHSVVCPIWRDDNRKRLIANEQEQS